ncbi:MAG: sigma-70 family RNA polymerase sigma factor [Anaerolineales bacterium]
MISDQDQKSFSLEALRDGDRAEFARLVEAYSPMIYRLGLKMLNNPQDAEDILQETFIKAYRHIGNFDGRSSISTWLYRIATNEALMSIRRKRPETISFDVPSVYDTEPQEPLQIVDWCCLPEDEFLTSEGRARLDEAANRLPTNLRVVFILRDIEGLSTRETAEVLEISEMAVKTRLSRARLRLREDLSEYFGRLLEKE